jgi:hypothetical protein
LALGFRGLSPSWWGEFCKKNKRHTHREREREREIGRETESYREKDTERKPSLLTGRYLPSSIFIFFRFQSTGWCYPYSGKLSP